MSERFLYFLTLLCGLLSLSACGEKEKKIEVQSIAISQSGAEMEIGETLTLKATVSPSIASYDGMTWTSIKPKVASVNNAGLVSAISEGSTTITVMAGGKTASCSVTVVKGFVAVTSISLDKTRLEMFEGDTETLNASVFPDDASDKSVTWTSSREDVATVNNGMVSAVAAGEATITASAGERTTSCTVVILKKVIPVTSISLSQSSLELFEGDTQTVTALILPQNATDKTLIWSSSNPSIASVDNGKITALAVGETTVSATAGNMAETCKVTVVPRPLVSSSARAETLSHEETLSLSDFPFHIKKGLCMSLYADIISFDIIYVGKGYQEFRGDWLKIDATNITLQHNESTVREVETVEHGLSISSFIKVVMKQDNNGVLHVVLQSLTGTFQYSFAGFGFEANYSAFVRSSGSSLSNVVLSATNTDFQCPVWACGDSYFGVFPGRWPYYIKQYGYFNFLINGLAGQNSYGALADLKRMLKFGTPKYLLWTVGMNDWDVSFINIFDQVKAICDQKGITMIAATIPTIPERDKETISDYVRSSGLRYIDFYKAVGTNKSGEWYPGYLDPDGIHPSALGAQALASQVMIDFPEIMLY